MTWLQETITDSQAEQQGLGLFTFQSSHGWADASGNIFLLPHMRVMRVLSPLPRCSLRSLRSKERKERHEAFLRTAANKIRRMRICAKRMINLFVNV